MPSTYTTRNRAEKQAAGENSNTWGTRLNTNLIDMFDAALDGRTAFTLSTTKTLTTADGSADEARMRFIDITGGTGGTVTIPNVEKWYLVRNGSSGDVIFTTGSGTTATLKTGTVTAIVSTGENVVYASKIDVSTQSTGTLAVANGGTGTTTSTGTGSVVLSASPTLTGTLTAATGTFTGAVTAIKADANFVAKATGTGAASTPWIAFTDTDNTRQGYVGFGTGSNSDIYISTDTAGAGVRMTTATTASAANLHQAGDLDKILRSTSSLKYKTDVETVDPAYNKALDLRPVWYRSLADADNPSYGFWGLIAEEVATLDPRLVHYGYQEDQYETVETESGPEKRVKAGEAKRPDGVQYERLAVLLLDVVQRQEKRIAALEAKLI